MRRRQDCSEVGQRPVCGPLVLHRVAIQPCVDGGQGQCGAVRLDVRRGRGGPVGARGGGSVTIGASGCGGSVTVSSGGVSRIKGGGIPSCCGPPLIINQSEADVKGVELIVIPPGENRLY